MARVDFNLLRGQQFVCYTGMETDLIFNKGIDLPEFAAFPLLETESGQKIIDGYYQRLIEFAAQRNIGVILDGVTWVASRDRAQKLGYTPKQLADINVQAVQLMVQARLNYGDLPTLICADVGPRADAYARDEPMSAAQAEKYHAEQLSFFVNIDVDFVTAYTIGYVDEAIGMARAALALELPIVISFTVETDGRLPSGMGLKECIAQVDEATNGYVLYYMINCAHPEHFMNLFDGEAWMQRIKGIVVNASRCSHKELNNATQLDAGDPVKLGLMVRKLRKKFPWFTVIGGCCGTDMRHLSEMF